MRVLAVPRSIARSEEKRPRKLLKMGSIGAENLWSLEDGARSRR